MHLTNAEEQIMKVLWKLDQTFFRDLLKEFPDPKPAPTTVMTLLKRMIDKGFVGYKQYGNSREYFPLVRKSDYLAEQFKEFLSDFFNNSNAQFASFFTNETTLTQAELKELRDLIDKKITKKPKK
jgi:BlaI family transcriptional regulator, penicillinase repressor